MSHSLSYTVRIALLHTYIVTCTRAALCGYGGCMFDMAGLEVAGKELEDYLICSLIIIHKGNLLK
jgi:hypothetical protein